LSEFRAWSAESRYPAFLPEASRDAASLAPATAKRIVENMEEDIAAHGG
jgi:hypothetical protein